MLASGSAPASVSARSSMSRPSRPPVGGYGRNGQGAYRLSQGEALSGFSGERDTCSGRFRLRTSAPVSAVKGSVRGDAALRARHRPKNHATHVRARLVVSQPAVSTRDSSGFVRRFRARLPSVKRLETGRPERSHNIGRPSLSYSSGAEWTRSAGACVTLFIFHSDSFALRFLRERYDA